MVNENLETPRGEDVAEAVREEVLDEIADLEEYARAGKRPPRCRGYRIRVNGDRFVLHEPRPTGREILTVAGLTPPDEYTLRVKVRGEPPPVAGQPTRARCRIGVASLRSAI